jgi:hypothetical protein
MARSQEYLKFTEKVRQKLNQGIGPLPPPSNSESPREENNEWLKLLYQQYTQRFINDNNKIWTVNTIFIPLCLAGLLSIKDLSPFNTALLGAGSIMLMWFWVIVAESHRAFQNRSQAIVEEIERHINFDIDWGPKLDPHKSILPPSRSVQRIRWNMLYAVIIIWVFATIGRITDTYDINVTPPKFTSKQEATRKMQVELVDSMKPTVPNK